jgi:GDPmannose 4,6-dehydratase
MTRKKALITGIGGQDGAFLAKLLLEKNYEVVGLDRRRVDSEYSRLEDLGIKNQIRFELFDLLEISNIINIIRSESPDEFYNLGAQSFVKASFENPILTSDVDAIGVLRILEAIRLFSPKTKFYQASTSEMFGKVQEIPQNEKTPFYPRSPYGVAKLFAHWAVINHESEYRGTEFVTQKIIHHIAKQALGLTTETLKLGNIEAKRDWGYAGDYVQGMYAMLQQERADDYVLATNKTVSVREFVIKTYQKAGISIVWEGSGINEIGKDEKTGKRILEISKDFYRPAEVELLIGDYKKAKEKLNWEPKVHIDELIDRMYNHATKKLRVNV